VPLSTTVTPASEAGRAIEWFVSGLGLALLALAMFSERKTPRHMR
jgi:apolipoprotein N-acyltransferase